MLASWPKAQCVGATGASAFGSTRCNRSGLLRAASTRISAVCSIRLRLRSDRLYTPFLEMTEAQFRATFDLNLMGGFHLIRAFAPGMLARGWGRIVNVASIVLGGEAGQADYAAAKAAVASLTRSLAAEFAPAVTVNCVAPGLTRTSVTRNIPAAEAARLVAAAMNPRMAEPSETAAAIASFLREDAGFLTGEMLAVSGGIRPHL